MISESEAERAAIMTHDGTCQPESMNLPVKFKLSGRGPRPRRLRVLARVSGSVPVGFTDSMISEAAEGVPPGSVPVTRDSESAAGTPSATRLTKTVHLNGYSDSVPRPPGS